MSLLDKQLSKADKLVSLQEKTEEVMPSHLQLGSFKRQLELLQERMKKKKETIKNLIDKHIEDNEVELKV